MFMDKFTLGCTYLILFWLRLISTIEVGQTSPVCTWTSEFLARVKVIYIRLNMVLHLDVLQVKIEKNKTEKPFSLQDDEKEVTGKTKPMSTINFDIFNERKILQSPMTILTISNNNFEIDVILLIIPNNNFTITKINFDNP